MTGQEALRKLLLAYSGYYDINELEPAPPFAAEAEFRLHDEQFFLMRQARISEADSREIVLFALVENLDTEIFRRLDERAWEEGLSRTKPSVYHRNTDVVLYILADRVEEDVIPQARKTRRYKSYLFGFHGWNGYRVLVCDLAREEFVHNRLGRNLGEIMEKVFG